MQEQRVTVEIESQIAIVRLKKYGPLTGEQVQLISQIAIECQQQVHPQLSGAGQSGLSGALSYGSTGGVGTAVGATLGGFTNSVATAAKFGLYAGVPYLATGAVNGLAQGSYSLASAKGTCTVENWRLEVERDPRLKGTIVIPVFAGKSWGNSLPPALDRSGVTRPPAR